MGPIKATIDILAEGVPRNVISGRKALVPGKLERSRVPGDDCDALSSLVKYIANDIGVSE